MKEIEPAFAPDRLGGVRGIIVLGRLRAALRLKALGSWTSMVAILNGHHKKGFPWWHFASGPLFQLWVK